MTTIDLIITVTLIVVILLCAAIIIYAWKGDKLLKEDDEMVIPKIVDWELSVTMKDKLKA